MIKRLLSCLMTVILTAIILGRATAIMQRKSSDYKYIPFFEHAQDYDVLFMGTSHVINAVFPMELWNDYGITSYNFGGHSNQLATTYWVMKNSLDYAKPKVMVIDCLALESMQKTSSNFSYAHLSLDAFPLSVTKIAAVNDLLNDDEIDRLVSDGLTTDSEKRTKLGLLWDYSVYHSRWEEYLSSDEFKPSATLEYGAESRVQISAPGQIVNNPGTTFTDETVGMKYLKKIIEECKENDIEVLLTYLPFPIANESQWISVNTVQKIADEYDVNYINFQDKNIVDYGTDCFDPNSHLNPSGAWKVTDYLGQYLVDNYNVDDHRGDENYNYWNDDYEKYESMKNSRLGGIQDLNTYLMLLEDSNYGYIMSVGDNTIFQDFTTLSLLKNKGVDISEINEDTKYIVVCGNECTVVDTEILENGTYGDVDIYFNDSGQYGAYCDGKELFVMSTDTLGLSNERIKINVFDMDNRDVIVDTGEFSIPKALGIEERYPDQYGTTVLSSKATRL